MKSPQGPHGTHRHSLLLAVLLGQLGSLFHSRSEPAFSQGHSKFGGNSVFHKRDIRRLHEMGKQVLFFFKFSGNFLISLMSLLWAENL